MLVQLLLCIRLPAYFPIVALVKTSGGKTCLQKTCNDMISFLIPKSLSLRVRPSKLVIDISVKPHLSLNIHIHLVSLLWSPFQNT
jgi:hypothetical protein